MHDGIDLPDDAIVDLLDRHFGIAARGLEPLGSELATVRRVTTDTGVVVAKVLLDTDVPVRIARWQGDAMVRAAAAGVPVPRLHPSREGETTVRARHGADAIHLQVSDWLGGAPLATITPDAATARDIGATAGRMSRALGRHPAPPLPVRHPWELRRSGEVLRDVLTRIADPDVRGPVAAAEIEFRRVVEPRLPLLPTSVVHHDLNDFNVLVRETTAGPRVSAVLDFGDLVVAPRIAELAVAAAYTARVADDPLDALCAVARGWLEVAPLDDTELSVLRASAIARLAVNLGVWTDRASSSRGAYARDRMMGGDALIRLLATDDDEVTDALERLRP
jgi:hydroxylysine kinase